MTALPSVDHLSIDAAFPRTSWSGELGAHWTRWIPLAGVLLFALGASAPLADMDLPMHLATGAWIARHHAVPFVEPFAWTRAGAPYYAYSWLPELLYYLLYAQGGAFALRAFHGLTFVAGGASLLWLARVAGWRAWTAIYLVFLSLLPAVLIAAFLRPQALLFPLVVLAWGAGLRVLDSARPARWVVALALIASAAANSHLLFPITALPAAIALTRAPTAWRRGSLVAIALVAGWMLSPYGLSWPSVFHLYFQHNALLDFPPRIQEIIPGFLFARVSPICLILVAVLGAIPWVLRDADTTPRERVVFALLWFAGLFAFGLAGRALLVWWFASLPALVRLIERAPGLREGFQRRTGLVVMAALPIVMSIGLSGSSRVAGTGLVSPARESVEQLASWLDAHARPSGRPKVLTVFNYGSYLTWRLPDYSMSVDGRSIFPDSAAAPDAYRVAADGPFPLGPWRSADLAILPLGYPVAAVLDTAADWKRVATAPAGALSGSGSGLWVRRSWLDGRR
ncbi:MAG: hypothetical protein ACM34L_01145 [Gemmatimonas sp.]